MTTFDQALANLQNSNNQRAAEAKGFNNDVARFQTQRANDTARLFMLAGELGKDIANRLAIRKENEKQHEELYKEFQKVAQGQFTVDPKFKESVSGLSSDQVVLTNAVGNGEKNGTISGVTAVESISESGIGDRPAEINKLHSKSLEYRPWIANQIKNNEGTFTAILYDPQQKGYTQQILRINDPNLNQYQQLARLQYLTKQFVAKTADGYDPRFLTYSQENGGSGYAMSIMTQNAAIRKDIEKNIVIQNGINTRNQAMTTFQRPDASVDDIKEAYTMIMNSGNLKGTGIMARDKAWNFLHDEVFKPAIENGYITHERLKEIASMELFDINGKKTLAEYDPARYGIYSKEKGRQGSMFTLADEYKSEQDDLVTERNKNEVTTRGDKLLKLVEDGGINVESKEFNKELKSIATLARENNVEFNMADFKQKAREVPDPKTTELAKLAVEKYYAADTAKSMSDASGQFTEDVANHVDVQFVIEAEDKDYTDNKDKIENIAKIFKKQEEVQSGNSTITQYRFPSSSAETVWDLSKGKLLRQLVKNESLPSDQKRLPSVIIDEFGEYMSDEVAKAKIESTWENYDAAVKAGASTYDDAKQAVIAKSIFARDSNLVYRNAANHPELDNNFTHEWQSEMYTMKMQTADFSSPNTIIREEEPYVAKYTLEKDGVKTIDWNKLIQTEQKLPDDLHKIAKLQNKLPYEFVLERATSSNQTLDEKTKEFFEVETLDKADITTTNALKTDNQNGFVTDAQWKMNLSHVSDKAGILFYDEDHAKVPDAVSKSWCNECIDSYGKWKAGSEEYGKLSLGLGMGLLKSISDTADLDFTEDGADNFFEATKDISKEELLASVYSNPTGAFEAAKHSGDINFLPKEDFSILEDKKQNDFFKILEILEQSLDNTQGNPYTTID